jgi:uncharacterized protein (TIGR03437 family)
MIHIALAFAIVNIAFAQAPQVSSTGVVNAASYAQPITPGSLVSIFGTDLATTTSAATSQPLLTELAGTTVAINGVNAPLLYVSPGQINVEVPSATSLCYGCPAFDTASFVVTTAAGSSASVQVPISYSAPAAFTVNGSGCGPAAALNVALDGSSAPNTPSNSAAPGDYVAIYGTGYGLVYFPPPDGASDANPQQLEMELGITLGVNTPTYPFIVPNYRGLAPGLVAVDQVDFQIPAGAQQGCSVPVVIVGQTSSPAVTLSIHSGGGQCVDPPVQSYGQLELIKTIASGTSANGETDTFTATFPSGPGLPAPQPMVPAAAGQYTEAQPEPGSSRACAVPGYTDLSAGPITISSASQSVTIQPVNQVGGITYLGALPEGFIMPGTYRISASGGPVQLQGSIPVGSPIQVQTAPLAPGTVISSSQALTVNWTGGDPGTVVTVTIVEGSGVVAYSVYAQADASAGSLTIGAFCYGSPISAGGNGVGCSLGDLPGLDPVEVIFDVTPAASQTVSLNAQGLTGPAQAIWDYRYVFAGLTLGN